MSSYIFNMNAIRTLHKGYSFFNTGFKRFISKGPSSFSLGNTSGFPNAEDLPIFSSFKVYYMTNYVLRRFYDGEFDLKEFLKDSKTAVEVVTRYLSPDSSHKLKDLVTPDVLEDLKIQTYYFSFQEKLYVAIDQREISACYTYDINIIEPDEEIYNLKCMVFNVSYFV